MWNFFFVWLKKYIYISAQWKRWMWKIYVKEVFHSCRFLKNIVYTKFFFDTINKIYYTYNSGLCKINVYVWKLFSYFPHSTSLGFWCRECFFVCAHIYSYVFWSKTKAQFFYVIKINIINLQTIQNCRTLNLYIYCEFFYMWERLKIMS